MKIKRMIPKNIRTNFPIRIPRINRIFLIIQKKQILFFIPRSERNRSVNM